MLDPTNPQSLSSKLVTAIYADTTGVLWICTHQGLNKLDLRAEAAGHAAFTRFKKYPGNTLPDDVIFAFAADNRGAFFLATGTGLARFDRDTETLTHYPLTFNPTGSASSRRAAALGQAVTVICPDQAQNYWLSTSEELIIFSPATGSYRQYHHDPQNPQSLSFNSIFSIYQDRGGVMWVGTGGKGLNKYAPHTQRFEVYDEKTGPALGYPGSSVRSLCLDGSGRLWIGSYTGLYQLSHPGLEAPRAGRTNSITRFKHDLKLSPSKNVVMAMLEDRQGYFWIAQAGLARYDPANDRLRDYEYDPNDSTSLRSSSVIGLHEDSRRDQVFWVATPGAISRLDRATEKFTAFTSREGLPDDVVYGILADDEGNLWMSTNKGISRFNPVHRTFRNYDVKDGLQSNEFNSGAYFKSAAGEMFFGGINGFNAFHPSQVRDNPHVPQVVFTGFQIFNQSVSFRQAEAPLRQSITTEDEIRLSYRDNVFSFEFAALDFSVPEKNQYAYKMEGFNQDWIQAGTKRTATYTNLDPGEYVFRVKGSNNDGVWNEQGAAIRIIIAPPWWQTWWAYGFYAFTVIAVVFGIVKGRVRYLEKRTRELETAVNERTAQIVLQREQLVAQKEILAKQAEKLQELDRIKSNFFANISHEFRTPLTLIMGPVEQAMSEISVEKTKQKLHVASKNAQRLLRLINQLLDLSKLESGKMRLQAARGDLVPFLRGLVMSFASLAEQRRIALHFHAPAEEIELYFDRDKVEKIFYNLLSNALKFTAEGGSVEVAVGQETKGEERGAKGEDLEFSG